MLRFLAGLALLAFAATSGIAGYRLLRTELAAGIYRERLAALATDYDALRDRYAEAVRRTAVTELWVRDGSLAVVVRTADGRLREVPTPYDPGNEIYVDFAVLEGRLWIRRVFADDTPPREGILVDPSLGAVDWDAEEAAYGKAAYRTLGEGRWVVSVNGSGALDLVRAPEREPAELAPAPLLREFEPMERAVDDRLRRIGPGEMLGVLRDAVHGLEHEPALP